MFKTDVILHPTDFDEHAADALKFAHDLAQRRGAELHLLHVAPSLGTDPIRGAFETGIDEDAFYRDAREQADQKMHDLIAEVEASDVTIKRIHSRGMAPGPVIVEYAESEDVDLVVMDTAGRTGLSRLARGSVAEEVSRHAPCSVLTMHEGAPVPEAIRNVLVPVDLSEFSRPLIRAARDVTASFQARMDVLHVVEPLPFPVPLVGAVTIHDLIPDPTDQAERQLRRILESEEGLPVEFDVHIREGHAATAIVDAVDTFDSDLIVMASHGLSGLERIMLGSVTARVIRNATCPVLVMRVTPDSAADETSATAESNLAT